MNELLGQAGGTLSLYLDPLRAREPQVNQRRDVGITLSQSPMKK